MISLVLLLILLWSFYIGYSRGIILQSYYTFASLLALIVASGQYTKLVRLFYLWVPFASASEGASTYYFDSRYLFELDKIFYAGLSFLAVYILVYAVMRFIGIFMHLVRFADPDTRVTNIVSGCLSVAVAVVSLQIFLTILATIPLAVVQDKLHASFLANALIEYTPLTSSFLKNLWISYIGS